MDEIEEILTHDNSASPLWTDGLICAFELVRGTREPLGSGSIETDILDGEPCYWKQVGWNRIYELIAAVHASKPIEKDSKTVAYVAAPEGPTWWCHVDASQPSISSWISNAHWLHPPISIALCDESKPLGERMRHLLYEVPVRVAGGLLFELLGQSVGDPSVEEEDIPVVIRTWQEQNFLLTVVHVKGSSSSSTNVLGCSEVQEVLAGGGRIMPETSHDVMALLACRLARWEDRVFRKYIFGTADEAELKFMNVRTQDDVQMFSVILNQEITRLSMQVIRVKWCLHAREEIVFDLLQHVRGDLARNLLEGIRRSTRQMIEEQEAVRDRLFTIQDVMQSTVRSRLQDQSLRVQHYLGVVGGCSLILSFITGLWGVNVDGIPGNKESPYAFAIFSSALVFIGAVLIVMGVIYMGWKKPLMEEKAEVRKLELQELVKMFEREVETHAQVRKADSRAKVSSAAKDMLVNAPNIV